MWGKRILGIGKQAVPRPDWKPGEPLPENNPWVRRLYVFAITAALLSLPMVAILFELELIRSAFWSINNAVADDTTQVFIGQRLKASVELAALVIGPSLTTIHDSTIWAYITINVVALCFLVAPTAGTIVQGMAAWKTWGATVPSMSQSTTLKQNSDGTTTVDQSTQTSGEPPPTPPNPLAAIMQPNAEPPAKEEKKE